MPALLAPLLGCLIGSVIAWAAFPAGRDGSIIQSRGFTMAVLTGLLVFAPATAYFLAFYNDWCLAYRVSEAETKLALSLAAALVATASVPLGYWISMGNARRQRSRQGTLSAGMPVALAAIVLFSTSLSSLSVSTTYAGYHGGFAIRPVAGTDLGYSLLWIGLIVSACVTWTVRSLHAAP